MCIEPLENMNGDLQSGEDNSKMVGICWDYGRYIHIVYGGEDKHAELGGKPVVARGLDMITLWETN